MNSSRGYFCMPPVNLGLHFDGMGSLLTAKLGGRVARKVLLQAHRYTAEEALADGIVDIIAKPDTMREAAMELAKKWQGKAKGDVYGVLRGELVGDAVAKFKALSYVHSRPTSRVAKVKL